MTTNSRRGKKVREDSINVDIIHKTNIKHLTTISSRFASTPILLTVIML